MLIANPLYDVVFKFLMEDARVERERQLEALKREIERLKRPIVEESAAPYGIHPAPVRRRKKAP